MHDAFVTAGQMYGSIHLYRADARSLKRSRAAVAFRGLSAVCRDIPPRSRCRHTSKRRQQAVQVGCSRQVTLELLSCLSPEPTAGVKHQPGGRRWGRRRGGKARVGLAPSASGCMTLHLACRNLLAQVADLALHCSSPCQHTPADRSTGLCLRRS